MTEGNYLEVGNRPWGVYYVMEDSPLYKVKKIIVNPGKRLSLQSHELRSEHLKYLHRLSNQHTEPLVIVEVQCGEYTGEDDIVRYDDDFGRK